MTFTHTTQGDRNEVLEMRILKLSLCLGKLLRNIMHQINDVNLINAEKTLRTLSFIKEISVVLSNLLRYYAG